jgi:hypothetical protein
MNEMMINRHVARDAEEKEDRTEYLRPLGEEQRGFHISLAPAANLISPLGVLGGLAVYPPPVMPTNATLLRRKRKNLLTALQGIPLSRDEGCGHKTNAAFTSFRRKFDISDIRRHLAVKKSGGKWGPGKCLRIKVIVKRQNLKYKCDCVECINRALRKECL